VRPTSAQILRGVVANLEELIVPQLEGPHAQSAGANAVMLLEHVILRLESEGEALAADNGEKRALLGSLGDVPAPLEDAAREVSRRLADTPEIGTYASIAALTEENEQLKSVLDDWLVAIHGAPELDEAETDRFRAPIRTQLRAQVDREAAFVVPIELERIFRNEDG
jgi:hypothetical protein